MKNICVITGTRAEYGLLKPVMKKIAKDEKLNLQIIATGMHLSPEFGMTYREIEQDGFVINDKVEMLLSADSDTAIAKSMGLAMIGFTDSLSKLSPDMVVALGDRYEILAAATTSMLLHIPIAHIHGGESTYGAMDELMRHAITKMSHLHFASTEIYRKRIIQLGEDPSRVFYVGALGVENIKTIALMNKQELEKSLEFDLSDKTVLITFHPETAESGRCAEQQFGEILAALDQYQDMKYIFTKANADGEGRIINRMIDEYVEKNKDRTVVFSSLGQVRYLSTLNHVMMVIGNSSSGILEVPSFGIPTINIGDRQKGRIQGKTIINCTVGQREIEGAIIKALDPEFRKSIVGTQSPYEKEGTSNVIVEEMKKFLDTDTIIFQKVFYDQ